MNEHNVLMTWIECAACGNCNDVKIYLIRNGIVKLCDDCVEESRDISRIYDNECPVKLL
jgi:hypothetical protein